MNEKAKMFFKTYKNYFIGAIVFVVLLSLLLLLFFVLGSGSTFVYFE